MGWLIIVILLINVIALAFSSGLDLDWTDWF
jgi:hypothetical protein